MKSLDYDLGYLTAGLEILERYLLSDDVFWAMNAKPPEGELDFPPTDFRFHAPDTDQIDRKSINSQPD